MCMLSGFPGLGRRMYKYGKVVNIRWLGKNRKSTLVSLDKVVCSSWMSWSRKGESVVGTIEDLVLYDRSEW
jgi:hypothetical protein